MTYSPYEYPPLDQQPPGPPPGRTGLIVALVVTLVVIVAGLGALAVLLVRNSSGTDEPVAQPTTSASGSASASASASAKQTTTAPTSAPSAKTPSTTTPAVPGFQGVAVPSRGIAYDVPAGWTVGTESVIRGFDDADGNRISGTGTAADGEDYCGSATRTITFVSRSDKPDPTAAATDVGNAAATLGYDKPAPLDVTPPAAVQARGGIAGTMIATSGNWQASDPSCTSTEFTVYTFAFPGPQNPILVLTIAADRGVADEVTPDLAKQIFGSVRPL